MKIKGKVIYNKDTSKGTFEKQTLKVKIDNSEDEILIEVKSSNYHYDMAKLYKKDDEIECNVVFSTFEWKEKEYQNILLIDFTIKDTSLEKKIIENEIIENDELPF